ncbi:hypothetical protein OG976_18270 [Mycobacterium sp. NBC_00419]|uniref:hypothetical protein n=1 Tax=Mycobacterium sp. NBC_00419 TaxID=2975989 RepID=UPI002E1D3539
MTATAATPAHVAEPPTPWLHGLRPIYRLVFRWAFIAVLTVFAFHESLESLLESSRAGSLNGYVWVVPMAAIMAAIGVARRERTELPIHDRQTDIIVGIIGMGVALMVHGVLLQRYASYFHLLRLDLLAMWFFVVSSSVVLFGLRPVTRFAWVWALLLAVFPLPYQIVVILLGGSRVAAGGAVLIIAASATAIAVGRTRSRAVVGAVGSWGVGLIVLMGMAVVRPNGPVFAFQMIPSVTAIALVGLALYFRARRGAPKRVLDRRMEPLAAKEVWSGLVLVLAVAVALSLVSLPGSTNPPATQVSWMTFGRPLDAPVGWHTTEQIEFNWVRRLFGRDSTLLRQEMVADTGNPKWDKFARPRTVIVDSTNTWRPFSLNVYPSVVLYDVASSRLSEPRRVDLGHGVTGFMYSIIDDQLLVTWNTVVFEWRNKDSAQRVLIGSVDNHEAEAPFPEPNGALLPTLGTLFTVLFRGNSVTTNKDPEFKDAEMLTQFGRGLVDAQLKSSESLG